MLDGLKGDDYSFADVVLNARERCEARFKTGAREAVVEGTDWTWEDEMNLLNDELVSVGDQCRKDETKKMVNAIEVSCPRGDIPNPVLKCHILAPLQETNL